MRDRRPAFANNSSHSSKRPTSGAAGPDGNVGIESNSPIIHITTSQLQTQGRSEKVMRAHHDRLKLLL